VNIKNKIVMTLLSLAVLAMCVLSACIHAPVSQHEISSKANFSLGRQVVLAGSGLGKINSITTIKSTVDSLIVVGGQHGAAFLTPAYAQNRLVSFKDLGMGETVPVDVENDGQYEFMDRGGGWAPVKLVSAKGQLLWSFPPAHPAGPAADQMASGDIDGDGVLEFIVGMNGDGGLFALEHDGSIKWRVDAGNVFAVEILDFDGDGQSEIVHMDRRDIVIRQLDGKEIRRFGFPVDVVRPLVWNLAVGQKFIVGKKGSSIVSFDAFGNEGPTVRLPRSKGYPDSIQPVRFEGKLYYAAANRIAYTHNTGHLYVFDAQGQVVYHEEFPERVEALAVVPDGQNPKNEILLLGVGAQLIEYRMNQPK
jgi:outer membrane protein assembly factor BamB